MLMLFAAVIAAGVDEPAPQPQGTRAAPAQASIDARERATNESLLAALRQRRAEIAQDPLAGQDKRHGAPRRYALEFLDRQIAKVKKDMER